MKSNLKGVISALIKSFNKTDKIDRKSLKKLINNIDDLYVNRLTTKAFSKIMTKHTLVLCKILRKTKAIADYITKKARSSSKC